MKIKYILFITAISGVLGFSSFPFTAWHSYSNKAAYGTSLWVKNETHILEGQTHIDDKVLRLALTAYLNAKKDGYASKPVLTVIDYSKPSSAKRLWVFDLRTNRTLFNTWVAHGKNSGNLNATSFSNRPGSLKSSIGVFQTATTYDGKHGYSLRIRGLEHGVNDSAYSRAIVVHGAPYANGSSFHSDHGLGRSWGCPAVSPSLATPIINTIKGQSIIFSYYPDQHWLSRSQFLTA